MAFKLKNMIGPRIVNAYWEGRRDQYNHPVCGVECEPRCIADWDRDDEGWSLAGRTAEEQRVLRQRFKRDKHQVLLLHTEGITLMFQEEPISTSIPSDRSTICGNVEAVSKPSSLAWPWTYQFDAAAKGPRLWYFRMYESETLEMLYAIDETTGLCCFEVGTEYQPERRVSVGVFNEEYWFRWECNPDGFANAPEWLEPIDDGPPPVEIRTKKVTEIKVTQNGGKGANSAMARYQLNAARRERERRGR